MGFVFTQYPVDLTGNTVPVLTNWTPSVGYMVLRSNSIASYFYYKIVLEIRKNDASGTLYGKLKQRRNGYSNDVTNNYARTFFDLREIINTQIVDTVFDSNYSSVPKRFSIHTVGDETITSQTDKIFSNSGDDVIAKPQIIKIFVKGYESYSTSANTPPTDQTGDAINNTLWWYGASFPLEQVRFNGSAYIQSDQFKFWTTSYYTDFFLSDVASTEGSVVSGSVRRNYVQSTDYHTVGFFNDNASFSSNLKYIEVVYYNANGTLNGEKQYIENKAANGGLVPNGTHTDYTRILYFGCGPANLENSSVDATDTSGGSGAGQAQPSNFSGYAYYSIRGCNTATPSGNTDYVTKPYYFILQDGSCKGFKVRRLAWINSKGAWDYFNFKMKSTQKIEIKRNNYNTMLGIYGGEKYSYSNTQRGQTTRNVEAIKKETLTTDWISEDEATLLKYLFISKNVNMVKNSDTDYNYPIMIKDTTYTKKTGANDGLIQYTIEIEYSNPINTNS